MNPEHLIIKKWTISPVYRIREFVLKTLIIGIILFYSYLKFSNIYIIYLLVIFFILQIIYYFYYLPKGTFYSLEEKGLRIKESFLTEEVFIEYKDISDVVLTQDPLEKLLTKSSDIRVKSKSLNKDFIIKKVFHPENLHKQIKWNIMKTVNKNHWNVIKKITNTNKKELLN